MSYVDAQSQLLIRDWAQCQQFGAAQQAIYIAPTRQGGLGMVSLSITAPAAHAASILNYRCAKNGQKCTITQSQINQACLEEAHKQLAVRDPSFAAHLENTKHGGSILTTSHAARASEDITAAALRILLKSPSVNAASSSSSTYACPGCSSTSIGRRANNLAAATSARSSAPSLSVEQYMHHALGCAAIPGGAVTKRHNAIRDLLYVILRNCAFADVVKEPRNLRFYDCPCGLLLSHDDYVTHSKSCRKATERPRTHGPDLLFTDHEGNVIALDIRVVNELSAQNAGKPIANAFAAAEATKEAKYGELCRKANVSLRTFGVSALGALSDTSKAIIKMIAKNSATDVASLSARISCVAVAGSAFALVTAEGHAAIRPAPRALSQATLKLLSMTLGVPLHNLDASLWSRVGVLAPTAEQLGKELASVTALVSQLESKVAEILQRAQITRVESDRPDPRRPTPSVR
jgi:hypothetical protein